MPADLPDPNPCKGGFLVPLSGFHVSWAGPHTRWSRPIRLGQMHRGPRLSVRVGFGVCVSVWSHVRAQARYEEVRYGSGCAGPDVQR